MLIPASTSHGKEAPAAQMDNLRQQHGELPVGFADDIRRRGDALHKAAKVIDDFYAQVIPLAAFRLPGRRPPGRIQARDSVAGSPGRQAQQPLRGVRRDLSEIVTIVGRQVRPSAGGASAKCELRHTAILN